MDERNLIDRIAAVTDPTCGHCGDPLGASVSDDFCSASCQQKWIEHHNDVQRLTGYSEPAGGWRTDAMAVSDGSTGGADVPDSDLVQILRLADGSIEVHAGPESLRRAAADFNEVRARMRALDEFSRRSKMRLRWTVGLTLVAFAVYMTVNLTAPNLWGWIALGVYLPALAALNVWSWRGSRRDRKRYLAPASPSTAEEADRG